MKELKSYLLKIAALVALFFLPFVANANTDEENAAAVTTEAAVTMPTASEQATTTASDDETIGTKMEKFFNSMGFVQVGNGLCLVMILVSFLLLYLADRKSVV